MIEELKAKAESLAMRPVEVEQTLDGKYIVLFMRFMHSPPPKGDTEQEALEKFIEYMEHSPGKELPDVNPS